MTQPAEHEKPATVAGWPGYLPPEEAARRRALDEHYDRGMNSTGVQVYHQLQQEDDLANAAVAGGGYSMDVDTMRTLLPEWEAIADKLKEAINLGQQLPSLDKPAEDEASSTQKQAADTHADAYIKSVQEQQEYAQGYAKYLKDAIEKYETGEQATAEALSKHGRGA